MATLSDARSSGSALRAPSANRIAAIWHADMMDRTSVTAAGNGDECEGMNLMNRQRLKSWAADPARVFGSANTLIIYTCLTCGLVVEGIAGFAFAGLGSVGYVVLRIARSNHD